MSFMSCLSIVLCLNSLFQETQKNLKRKDHVVLDNMKRSQAVITLNCFLKNVTSDLFINQPHPDSLCPITLFVE